MRCRLASAAWFAATLGACAIAVAPGAPPRDAAPTPSADAATRGCRTLADCPDEMSCVFHSPGCDATGVCEPRCTRTPAARYFCGCAGSTIEDDGCDHSLRPYAYAGRCVPCDRQQACVTGMCAFTGDRGVYWNGARCVVLRGCLCEGADCAMGYPDWEGCAAAHAQCASDASAPPPACHRDGDCPRGQACAGLASGAAAAGRCLDAIVGSGCL